MIYIVCGPPGSGKSTLVEKNRRWGDLVIDLDALFHAVTNLPWYEKPEALLPVVTGMRDYLIKRWLRRGVEQPFYNAWIIMGGARFDSRERLAREVGGQVYVLETNPHECLRRISNDPRRADKVQHWQEIISHWWREYERREEDHVIVDGKYEDSCGD